MEICSVWTGYHRFETLIGDGRSGFALQLFFNGERCGNTSIRLSAVLSPPSKRIWYKLWRRDRKVPSGQNLFGIPAYARIGERHDYDTRPITLACAVRGFSRRRYRIGAVVPEIFGPLELHERRGETVENAELDCLGHADSICVCRASNIRDPLPWRLR